MREGFPVTLAELAASGGRLAPAEAASVVLDVCRQVRSSGPRRGVSAAISAASVFIDSSGRVTMAGGPPAEDDQSVPLLGHLLDEILGGDGRHPGDRPSARLRALAATAVKSAGGRRLAVGDFAAQVRRLAPEHPQLVIAALYARWKDRACPREVPAGEVPETLRRLLPEADLEVLAGMKEETLTLTREPGSRRSAWRRVALTAAATLLFAAGGLYFLGDTPAAVPRAEPSSQTAGATVPGRELLAPPPPAVRPAPTAGPSTSTPETEGKGRVPKRPDFR